MVRYPIANAAQLAQAAYSGPSHRSLARHMRASLDAHDVQALFLDSGLLLIPGSNSVADYLKYNLRVLNIGGKRYRLNDTDTEQGASGTTWHQGFLRFSKVIYDWLERERLRPAFIIGHSLGAAATQVLVRTYGVPGIAFAAPRPRKSRGRIKHSDLCLCLNRDDDLVCALPRRFHHMGQVHRALAAQSSLRAGHNMRHYRRVVDELQSAGRLGTHWPA
ncbi:MAG: hypothetical protein AAGF60_14770 [Pseudomonadota bacterium]